MNPDKQYLRLFFDLDNTLTRSRTPITIAMRELLESLPFDIVVISGASVDQIKYQLNGLSCYTLGQNGNHAVQVERELWCDFLTPEEVADIEAHIATLPLPVPVPDEHDLVENRGSQISFSIYGHHAPVADKEKIDPDQAHRISMLKMHPLVSDTVEVKIAGTTCLDYFKKGRTKGYNVTRLCQFESWNMDTCLYFGDALYPGGNDETVIGVIDTQAVANPDETFKLLTGIKDSTITHE
jgi:HAD superfamily hydrolase (TIGR01484 family)